MSDQDEISRLLAEAAAQTEAAPPRNQSSDTPDGAISLEPDAISNADASPAPATIRKLPPRLVGRNNDVLGFSWLNGSLHAAVFRRQKLTHSWSCPTSVRT